MSKCHPTQPFRCPGQEGVCISIQYLCDGAADCRDAYDEDPRLCTAGKHSRSECHLQNISMTDQTKSGNERSSFGFDPISPTTTTTRRLVIDVSFECRLKGVRLLMVGGYPFEFGPRSFTTNEKCHRCRSLAFVSFIYETEMNAFESANLVVCNRTSTQTISECLDRLFEACGSLRPLSSCRTQSIFVQYAHYSTLSSSPGALRSLHCTADRPIRLPVRFNLLDRIRIVIS
jgi:hypothetical protein